MLLAIKSNRQYKITEDERQKYVEAGYRIATLKGGNLVFEKIETKEDKLIAELEARVKELEAKNAELADELKKAQEAPEEPPKEPIEEPVEEPIEVPAEEEKPKESPKEKPKTQSKKGEGK